MMRRLLVIIICSSFTLLFACSSKDASNGNEEEITELRELVKEKEEKIEELTETIEEQTRIINDSNMEKENFPFISQISREFVQAHTTGDKEKLQQLLSEDITLLEKDNSFYATSVNDNGFEWLLYNEGNSRFVDWVIQGYEYDRKTDTYHIFIREFYVDEIGEPESPPTFLGLTITKYNNEWKISSLAFDV